MAAEDLTSSNLAVPPRPPLSEETLEYERLKAIGRRVINATWELGLPSWFWGEGVCLAGMVAFGEIDQVAKWLDTHQARAEVTHVNNVAPGIAAAMLQQLGLGDYSDLGAKLARWALEDPAATRDSEGILEHWPGGIWADTAFMAGIFLAEWAVATGDEELLAQAQRQVLGHFRTLQNENGLCAHGTHKGEPIWCFWGRANAWLALAAVRLLEIGGADPELEERLIRQLDAVVACLPEHGIWDVLVDGQVENQGVIETSAAAGLAAALLRAAALVPSRAQSWGCAGKLALRAVLAYEEDGLLTRVSAGTILQLIPFGYSVIRDDRPQLWGQGLLLFALAAASGAVGGAGVVGVGGGRGVDGAGGV